MLSNLLSDVSQVFYNHNSAFLYVYYPTHSSNFEDYSGVLSGIKQFLFLLPTDFSIPDNESKII